METAEKPITIVRDVNFVFQNARIGQFISVEIVSKQTPRESFKTHLVGCRAGGYLIVEMPNVLDYGNIRDQLTVGKQLIIRSICEKTTGECMGFYSTIEGVVRVPYPVLFISYPTEVETRELRNEKRHQTQISAYMFRNQGGEELHGTIIDLSNGGCRFELPVDEQVVKIKAKQMYLRYTDPNNGEQVVRFSEVCSQRREAGVLSIGFAFIPPLQQTA